MKTDKSYYEFVEYDDKNTHHTYLKKDIEGDEDASVEEFKKFFLNRYTFKGFRFCFVL